MNGDTSRAPGITPPETATAPGLVLSTFNGMDVLGMGFEDAGYCVVKAGDPVFGQRTIENFHPPRGIFGGVIGGPPCQLWATSQRANDSQDQHANLIPEFERVVSEAWPEWFLMENVPGAPVPDVGGYEVQHRVLFAEELGAKQRRPRRFTFGTRTGALLWWPPLGERGRYAQTVVPGYGSWTPGKTVETMLEAFGLPTDWFDRPERRPETRIGKADGVLTASGKRLLLGQAVPLDGARALAEAILQSTKPGASIPGAHVPAGGGAG